MTTSASRNKGPGRPALLQALIDSFRTPDLRFKILFTIGMLFVFRALAHVPVVNVDKGMISRLFEQGDPTGQLLGFFDLFSGGGLRSLSIISLGVYPYITASIIMQIMNPVIPYLQNLAKEGEQGRQKINQITHYMMIPIAIAQGYGQ